MPKNFYQRDGGDPTNIIVWSDPSNEDTDELGGDSLTALQQLQTLGDESLVLIASGGIPGLVPAQGSLAALKDWLDDEIDRRLDLLDYPTYGVKQETIGNVFDGAWWSPEAVESVSSEEVSAAVNAIDGQGPTHWETANAPASITFRLRGHRKNVEQVRIWTPNNTLKTFLNGVTVRAAESLSMIDDANNIMASGVNIEHAGDVWSEIVFANPNNPNGRKRCRYIKLDIAGSQHATDIIQIRRIEARVVTTLHSK